jgi:hypothetical protein
MDNLIVMMARADSSQLLLGFSQLSNNAQHGVGSQGNVTPSLTRFSKVQVICISKIASVNS